MQSKGLNFLQPIWAMIYSKEGLGKGFCQTSRDGLRATQRFWKVYGLNLSESEVEVTYTRYINTMKSPMNPKPSDKTIDEAADAGLTPGLKLKKTFKI